MSEIPGVPVRGPMVPWDTGATYPTHAALYGKGGHRTVETLAERNEIFVDRLEQGMTVAVNATGLVYKLKPGFSIPTNNGDWAVFGSGGSGGVAIGDPIFGGTPGSVLFIDPFGNLGEDNNDFFYDSVNKRLSVDSKETTIFLSGVGVTTGIKFSTHLDNPTPGVNDFASFFSFIHTPFAQLPAFFAGAKSRGTEALPAPVVGSDILFALGGLGYDGAGYCVAGQINVEIDPAGTVSGSSMPGIVRILTSNDGTNIATPKMSIMMDGKVGIGTLIPLATLDVQGSISVPTGQLVYFDDANNTYIHKNGDVLRIIVGGFLSAQWNGNLAPNEIFGGTIIHGGGQLLHDNGFISIDWQNDSMRDGTFGTQSLNWFNRNLFDHLGNSTLNWDSRQTLDDGSLLSIDWNQRQLWHPFGGGVKVMDWLITALIDINAKVSIDWGGRSLSDSASIVSLAWDSRQLATNDGTNILDWNNHKIGIGTTTPNSILSLGITGDLTKRLLVYDDNAGAGQFYGFGLGIGLLTIFSQLGSSGTAIGTMNGSTFAEHFRFTDGGHLGIGTTTPSTRLGIAGALSFIDGPDVIDSSLYEIVKDGLTMHFMVPGPVVPGTFGGGYFFSFGGNDNFIVDNLGLFYQSEDRSDGSSNIPIQFKTKNISGITPGGIPTLFNFDMSGSTVTANNSGSNQVAGLVINAPTYASTTATLALTTASTMFIDGAPIAGANTVIQKGHALRLGSSLRVDGDGTNVFYLPTDATGNATAATGRVAVDIGGVTKYLRYYND